MNISIDVDLSSISRSTKIERSDTNEDGFLSSFNFYILVGQSTQRNIGDISNQLISRRNLNEPSNLVISSLNRPIKRGKRRMSCTGIP